MQIKFKKLSEDAIIPTKGREGDACFDLYAAEDTIFNDRETRVIKTNISMEIPEGYFGKIYTRSGMALKGWSCDWGVIDSNYRWDIGVIIRSIDGFSLTENGIIRPKINKGERIAQIAIHKVENVEFVEVEELSDTNRGDKWYGSSGK